MRVNAGSFCIAGSAASARTIARSTSDAAPRDTSQITSLVNLSVTGRRLDVTAASSPTKIGHTFLMAPPTRGSVASGPSPPKSGAPCFGLPPISDLTLPRAFETPLCFRGDAAAGGFHDARSARSAATIGFSSTLSSWSELAYEIGRSIRWTAGCVRQVCSSDGRSSVRSRRWPTAPYL